MKPPALDLGQLVTLRPASWYGIVSVNPATRPGIVTRVVARGPERIISVVVRDEVTGRQALYMPKFSRWQARGTHAQVVRAQEAYKLAHGSIDGFVPEWYIDPAPYACPV